MLYGDLPGWMRAERDLLAMNDVFYVAPHEIMGARLMPIVGPVPQFIDALVIMRMASEFRDSATEEQMRRAREAARFMQKPTEDRDGTDRPDDDTA